MESERSSELSKAHKQCDPVLDRKKRRSFRELNELTQDPTFFRTPAGFRIFPFSNLKVFNASETPHASVPLFSTFKVTLLLKEHVDNIYIHSVDKLVGVFPLTFHGPLLGSWERAEQYAQSYIEDFTHWVVGWVDWNIVLDEAGGPNYVNGTVDAPIIVNTTAKNEFYKQPMFYVIGHFSRFIVENSTRIKVHSSNDCVLTVGYQRPDKSIVIVLFNKDSQETNIRLRDGNTKIRLTVPPRSIHTLVYY